VSASTSPIYTIGHSNLPLETFLSALTNHGITTLADVRTRPFSRFPRFNRASLERSLSDAGIVYTFFGDSLGGRPSDPSCYRDGMLPERKEDVPRLIDYAAVAARPWFRDGLAELVELSESGRIAVMCSEGDPNQCHRQHLIAQELLDRLPVLHIVVNKDGTSSAVPAERTRVQEALL
jgi:uncharacterized protein (DUF488 family)